MKYTKETLQLEALKYITRSEFYKNSPTKYNISYKNGFLDEICSHMQNGRIFWTYEKLQNEALKYDNKKEFKLNSTNAYNAACDHKILKDITKHMDEKWTKENLHKISLKYNTRNEFRKNDYDAYKVAWRRNILNSICEHMSGSIIWDIDMIKTESLKYNTRQEFSNKSHKAYVAAQHRGILNDVCSHMIRGICGFNINTHGYIYYIRFDSEFNSPVYKIGITNNKNIKKRIKGMGVSKWYKPTILKTFYYDIGLDAYKMEQSYHKEFERFKYYEGKEWMNNGYTELYYKDVLELDKEIYND